MNISYYILTFNRPNILAQSIETLFSNTIIKPNEVWIIDDGSENHIKNTLFDFSVKNSRTIPINLIMHGHNMGIGYSFERVYNLMKQNDELDIACIIESDYVWRKDWLDDILKVFKDSPYTIAIAGTDHPDMYDINKTHGIFPEIMKECFGQDLESRNYLYKEFDLNGIKVQGVSNSCGCMIIHWKRLQNIIQELENHNLIPINDYWKRLDRAFHKKDTHNTRKYADDGWMSSTISMYGEKYLKMNNLDITTNFPILSICDYSISQHICGGGVNGMIVPEGSTFIFSPKWNNEYLQTNPRISNETTK